MNVLAKAEVRDWGVRVYSRRMVAYIASIVASVFIATLLVHATLEGPHRLIRVSEHYEELAESRFAIELMLVDGPTMKQINHALEVERRNLGRVLIEGVDGGRRIEDEFAAGPNVLLFSRRGLLVSYVGEKADVAELSEVLRERLAVAERDRRVDETRQYVHWNNMLLVMLNLSSPAGDSLGTMVVGFGQYDLPLEPLGSNGFIGAVLISALLVVILLWLTPFRRVVCEQGNYTNVDSPGCRKIVFAILFLGCCLAAASSIGQLVEARNIGRVSFLENSAEIVGKMGNSGRSGIKYDADRPDELRVLSQQLLGSIATVDVLNDASAPYLAEQNVIRSLCETFSKWWVVQIERVFRCDAQPKHDMVVRIKDESGKNISLGLRLTDAWDLDIVGGITLECLAAAVLAFLIGMEIVILLDCVTYRLPENRVSASIASYGVIRPAVFLFLFGIDISMSFLPLHAENLYEPFLGLSKEVAIGLPLSVEFLCVGVFMVVSGVWLDKSGWRRPFVVGVCVALGGVIYCWLASSIFHFIVARGLVGIGYGLALMAAQGFVIERTDGSSKAQGLANLIAGLYSGSICGAAVGAVLAERLGYGTVFLLGAVLLVFVLIYVSIFIRGLNIQKVKKALIAESPGLHRLWKFIGNRVVLALMILSSLPASVAVFGFLYYFSPLYLDRVGASESTIGQVLMIYGICIILIGPSISRLVDRSPRKRLFVFSGCVVGGVALLSFIVFSGIFATALAVLLLGLSSSVVLASQSTYALQLRVTQDLGEGKALSIFRASSRIGQMLGPLVFAWFAVGASMEQGIAYLGWAYLVAAIVFLVITHRDSQMLQQEGD